MNKFSPNIDGVLHWPRTTPGQVDGVSCKSVTGTLRLQSMEAKTLLVVDDEAAVRRSTRKVLESAGYDVLEAASGEEAIRLARTESIQLIMLDIRLPGMDGTKVAGVIRQHPETKHIPIIFCTGLLSSEGEKGLNHQIGGFYFLTKPYEMDRLLSEVAKRVL